MTDQDMKKETQDHAIRIALVEQELKGTRDELHKIHGSVDKINDKIGQLVWAVISAIILGAMQFILKGGLNA